MNNFKKIKDNYVRESAEVILKKFPELTIEKFGVGSFSSNIKGTSFIGNIRETGAFLSGFISGANLNGLDERIGSINRKNCTVCFTDNMGNTMEERKWGEGLSASFLAFLDGFYIGKTGEGYRR